MPRFHLVLAANASAAVLIRRGPKRWTCVFGWDRSDDAFQPGQCVKGYLEARGATLSPCGKYFAYAMHDYQMLRTGNHGFRIYSAILRPPWLKALAFWDRGGVGLLKERSGGLKLDVHPYHPHHSIAPDKVHEDWTDTGIELVRRNKAFQDDEAFERWRLEGWTSVTPWEICPEDECPGVASWWKPN